jgi:hypothetical protein
MPDGSIFYAEPVLWGWDIQKGYDNENDVAANRGGDNAENNIKITIFVPCWYTLKFNDMLVISSREFRQNQKH